VGGSTKPSFILQASSFSMGNGFVIIYDTFL
jgi:hypothetical protein